MNVFSPGLGSYHHNQLFSLLGRLGLRTARGPLSGGMAFRRVGSAIQVTYDFVNYVNIPNAGPNVGIGDYVIGTLGPNDSLASTKS